MASRISECSDETRRELRVAGRKRGGLAHRREVGAGSHDDHEPATQRSLENLETVVVERPRVRRSGRGGAFGLNDPQRLSRGLNHLGTTREPIVRRLGKAASHDVVDSGRKLATALAERRRHVVDVCPEHGDGGFPDERRLAGQALEEHAAERVHVGATVDLTPLDQLGCDVLGGTEDMTGRGERGLPRHELADAEVRKVGTLATAGVRRGQEHVARLDVTMHETSRVGGVQRVSDLGEHGDRAVRSQGPFARNRPTKIGPVDVAHRDVQHPVRVAGVMDGNDARMLDRRRLPRLAQEPSPVLTVLRELGREQLERDVPVEPRIERPVDDAHPAGTDDLLDPVGRDLRPDVRVARLAHRYVQRYADLFPSTLAACASGARTGRSRGPVPARRVDRRGGSGQAFPGDARADG